ncbi:MAG: 16S rRNA (cytosine(1402)-N(4))-methyltransferase, partial [Arenicellales bacterium]|nr:16S rRNA (cytosine(1402)-N(4))-methyltransferase [Arenicellales bacterium]
MSAPEHAPVMVEEIVEALNIRPDGIYVDATFGRGGHTRAILEHLGPSGRVLAIDRDPAACRHAREWMALEPRLSIAQAPFAELARVLEDVGLDHHVAGIVLDLGVSSPQLDDPGRGF